MRSRPVCDARNDRDPWRMFSLWAQSEVPWPLPVPLELRMLEDAVDEAVELPQADWRHRIAPLPCPTNSYSSLARQGRPRAAGTSPQVADAPGVEEEGRRAVGAVLEDAQAQVSEDDLDADVGCVSDGLKVQEPLS